MKEANIFLIDLVPSIQVGCMLRGIIEPHPNLTICAQYTSRRDEHCVPCIKELIPAALDFQVDLIIFVLSSCHLKNAEILFRAIQHELSKMPIIVVVESCNPDEMLPLLKHGTVDFSTLPLRELDILPRFWRLLEHRREQNALTHRLKEKLGLKQLIGNSPSFLDAINKIPKVAKCDVSVLISGETGTGKELCARAIHYLSLRANKPFVPFNCGAIPADLMENELFGHVQGAFTGAATAQPGLIGTADKGTLFMDDIDCLPLSSQSKFLRFLQEKEYRQLGSAKMYQADVRIIAATNADLEAAVDAGKLRRDLYYRLNAVPLMLPALRDRREDIPLLARHFLTRYNNDFDSHHTDFTPEAMKQLLMHDWPGNVRELQHVVERAVLFAEYSLIRQDDILLSHKKAAPCHLSFKEAKANAVDGFEKSYIESTLSAYQGNITRAAQAAQKNRRAFWELIQKHRIDVQAFKPGQLADLL